MNNKKKILVFTATYNEAENIDKFITTVTNELPESDLLIIDDNSPDETYKKVKTGNEDISEKEQEAIEKICEEIRNRDIIDVDEIHDPTEINGEGKIVTGPPTLTRFESARIMGARALQLSLGAPPFIPIPKDAATSLDIAIKELEKRVIPITIRRILPNGDYQNIPISNFD